jgi:gamma-glutamyl:cysteine ligase YbdK (ATP-grasp superfamily)
LEAVGATGLSADVRSALDRISATTDVSSSRATSVAIANLAEGIQGLVQHMRSEQQLIRDWVEAQAAQQHDIKRLLERLASETERS